MPTTPSRRSLFALAGLALGGAALSRTALADGADMAPPQRRSPRADAPAPLTSETMVGKRLRVIKSGDMMTMDYSEDRINIEVDDQNTIIRVFVG